MDLLSNWRVIRKASNDGVENAADGGFTARPGNEKAPVSRGPSFTGLFRLQPIQRLGGKWLWRTGSSIGTILPILCALNAAQCVCLSYK
jgi:hypothetical protein